MRVLRRSSGAPTRDVHGTYSPVVAVVGLISLLSLSHYLIISLSYYLISARTSPNWPIHELTRIDFNTYLFIFFRPFADGRTRPGSAVERLSDRVRSARVLQQS